MRRFVPVVLALLGLLGPAATAPRPAAAAEGYPDVPVSSAVGFALAQLTRTVGQVPTTAYPSLARGTAPWTVVGSGDWVSGFFPGQLWLAYQLTGNAAWANRARAWQSGIEAQKTNTSTHDLGFMFDESFGNGLRLSGDPAMRSVLLEAAASLSTRYSPVVHALKSWDTGSCGYPVVVDSMMNVELLFWAAAHGGSPAYRDQAVGHALTVLANHVRPDGSTFHYVCFDPTTGRRISRGTLQGYSDGSTWSRGQAWALSGFTTTYAYTHDGRFLSAARHAADYFLGHLPRDGVPYWDFDVPVTASTPRDTSAGAVAATGLLELARIDPDGGHRARYAAAGQRLVRTLTQRPWLAVGSGSRAILLHGSASVPSGVKDTGLTYGDYYLLRAILALRLLPTSRPALPIARVAASSAAPGDPPSAALDGNVRTYWGAGSGAWLRLDLGGVRTVHAVSVAWRWGDVRSQRFRIDTSTDGTHWAVVFQGLSSGRVTTGETYDVPDRAARFVRVINLKNTENATIAVSEVRLR